MLVCCRSFLRWTSSCVDQIEALWTACVNVLCALCYCRPAFFKLLQQGVEETSASDSTLDWASDARLKKLHCLARVVQSPPAAEMLLYSGLLPSIINRLTKGFTALAQGSSEKTEATSDQLCALLKTLAVLCQQEKLQEWFGSDDATSFWQPMLAFFCQPSPPPSHATRHRAHCQLRSFVSLQQAALLFFEKVAVHQWNTAKRLVHLVCSSLGRSSGLPRAGFLRQFLLQLLLRSQTVKVVLSPVRRSHRLSPSPKVSADSSTEVGSHPGWPVGRGVLTYHVPLSNSLAQIASQLLPGKSASSTTSAASAKSSSKKSQTGDIDDLMVSVYGDEAFIKTWAGGFESKTPSSTEKHAEQTEASPSCELTSPAVAFYLPGSQEEVDESLTVAKLLSLVQGLPQGVGCVELHYDIVSRQAPATSPTVHATQSDESSASSREDASLGSIPARSSRISTSVDDALSSGFLLLHLFASAGGLRLLANQLPCNYLPTSASRDIESHLHQRGHAE